MIWPFRPASPSPPSPLPVDAAVIVRRARHLRFRVRSGAVADLAGAYQGARPGTGLAFRELRPYEPGDDVRHLDGNATARQGRPYVRHFAEERALGVWLIVDVSASLRFGPEGRTKADRAAQAAALIVAAAIRSGDRAGLVLVGDRIETEVPQGGGTRHLSRLLRALVATPAASRTTNLTAGLDTISRSARRSLVVALGDFLTLEAEGPWRRAARRHEVVALRIIEPREEALPVAGLIALEDAETGARRIVDAGSRRVRAAYALAARERRAAFRAWCAGAGLTGLDLSTAEDPLAPLIRFFRGRPARRWAP